MNRALANARLIQAILMTCNIPYAFRGKSLVATHLHFTAFKGTTAVHFTLTDAGQIAMCYQDQPITRYMIENDNSPELARIFKEWFDVDIHQPVKQQVDRVVTRVTMDFLLP